MRRVFILIVCIVSAASHRAACQGELLAEFSFPSAPYNVCRQEPVQIENLSQNALQYLWDFCPETFTETPLISGPSTISGLLNGWGYRIIKDENEWFGFLVSRSTNKLFRLEFGTDPSNTPTIYDLGNPGDLLVSPQGLDVVKQDGKWFGFVGKGETTSGQIVRLDFGNDPRSSPTAVGLGTFGINGRRIRDVKAVKQGADWVLISIVDNDAALVRVNYRNSFENVVAPEDISSTGPLAGANLPLGFSVVKHLGNWIVHTVSFSNNGIQQYNFGNNIFNTPVLEGQFTFPSVARPYYIKVIREADIFYGFVANESKNLSIIKFGDFTAAPEELDNVSLPKYIGFDLVRTGSKNMVQGALTGTNLFKSVTFENQTCAVDITSSMEMTPQAVLYNSPGIYKIELVAEGADAQSDIFSATLSVNTATAPSTEIISEHICVDAPIGFSVNSTAAIKSWDWDFGDNFNSNEAAPVHQYALPGDFTVRIRVVDINDCGNTQAYPLSVFPSPVADFEVPAGVVCTNNAYVISPGTTDTYDGNLTYQWYVDDNLSSSERNLQYTFLTTGPKQIRLKTSIPGCSDEITKTTGAVESGPLVDFTFAGTCEDDLFAFQHQVSDPVESYLWDFGDNQTSPDPNPSHIFPGFGNFAASLRATNAIGCETTITKPVEVQAKPQVAFYAEGPPNACSDASTTFQNQTVTPDGQPITDWLWNFGDSGLPDPQTQPLGQHVYNAAGTYHVTLTATTAHGCEAVGERDVVIHQSPPTAFTFTPACEDQPVRFTGPAGNDIASWYWVIGTSYYHGASPTHTFMSPGDYALSLEVTSSNGCVSGVDQSLHVPDPLTPDFSVLRNCAGQETVFTDITTGADAPVSREWRLNNGEVYALSPFTFVFPDQGAELVTLTVTTAAGCVYEVAREIEIRSAPVAAFSADPPEGAFPLEVTFLNTSTAATRYLWEFSGGASSTEASPVYTYETPGVHSARLTAYNDQQCTDTFESVITAVAPLPDVDIEMITLLPNADGSVKLVVTIHNKGNTVLRGLGVDLDFSGTLALREVVSEVIPPGSKFNFVFSTGIMNPEMLHYLCVSLDLQNDLSPAGNRMCTQFENGLLVFPAYPNPAAGIVKVEWISEDTMPVSISLSNALGQYVFSDIIAAVKGFNQQTIDLRGLDNGVYMLHTAHGKAKSSQRIVILDTP